MLTLIPRLLGRAIAEGRMLEKRSAELKNPNDRAFLQIIATLQMRFGAQLTFTLTSIVSLACL